MGLRHENNLKHHQFHRSSIQLQLVLSGCKYMVIDSLTSVDIVIDKENGNDYLMGLKLEREARMANKEARIKSLTTTCVFPPLLFH